MLSREEVRRLLTAVYEPRFRVILQLIYACGLRGARRSCVRDIHAAQSRIHIRQAKGGKDRYVPSLTTMLNSLREFWKTHRHPKPGLSSRGSRLARTGDATFGWSRPKIFIRQRLHHARDGGGCGGRAITPINFPVPSRRSLGVPKPAACGRRGCDRAATVPGRAPYHRRHCAAPRFG